MTSLSGRILTSGTKKYMLTSYLVRLVIPCYFRITLLKNLADLEMQGCLEVPHIDYDFTSAEKDTLRFTLCIDPNYYKRADSGPPRCPITSSGRAKSRVTRLSPASGTTREWARLPIDQLSYASNGPALTYELGFHLYGQNLPDGPIWFYASGPTIEQLAKENGTLEDP